MALVLELDGQVARLVDDDGRVKAEGRVVSAATALVESGDMFPGMTVATELRFEGEVV